MMINQLIDTINSTPSLRDNVKPYGFLKMRKTYPTVTGIRTNTRETVLSCSCTAKPVFKAQPLRDVFKKNIDAYGKK